MSGSPAVKCCLNCGREVFSVHRGDVTVKPPARGEKFEASGNVVAVCKCGRRVTWFKVKKAARAVVTTG